MNPIAVEGFSFEIKQPNYTIEGAVQTVPNPNVFIDGKKIYAGDTSVLLSTIKWSSYTAVMVSFVLNPSGENVLADGEKVLLENDESQDTSVDLINGSSPYDTKTVLLNLYVTDSGQTNVEVE